MFLSGHLSNFCTPHDYLWLPLYVGYYGQRHGVQCTLAIATGLTDHIWSVDELLSSKAPHRFLCLPSSIDDHLH